MNQCVDGLGDCLAAADGDIAVRERSLQVLFGMFRFNLDIGGYGLGEAAEDFMLELATDEEKRTIVGWVRSAMLAATGKYDDYARREFGRFLLDLTTETDSLADDAFLEICRESGRVDDLVDRLLTLERLAEALAEADRAGDSDLPALAEIFRTHGYDRRFELLVVKRIETTRVDGLVEWLQARYEERGELAEGSGSAPNDARQRPDIDRSGCHGSSGAWAAGMHHARSCWPSGPLPGNTACWPTSSWKKAKLTGR